jgi:hypothetical protein
MVGRGSPPEDDSLQQLHSVAGKTHWVLEPIGTREVVSNLDTRSKSRDIHTNQCSNQTCHVTQPPTHRLTCSAVTALVRTP